VPENNSNRVMGLFRQDIAIRASAAQSKYPFLDIVEFQSPVFGSPAQYVLR